MTLVISTGVSLSSSWLFPADPDAAAYVAAVEAADGQTLETATKVAIDNFVIGCKADGIWNAIKASCIMAGARTLAGALVPLKGTVPTRFGTEAGWIYNRKTGLRGNGTNNYVNTNRSSASDVIENSHVSAYLNSPFTESLAYAIGGAYITLSTFAGQGLPRHYSYDLTFTGPRSDYYRFIGASRNNNSSFTARANGNGFSFAVPPQAAGQAAGSPYNYVLFAQDASGYFTLSPISFYSIGEAIDLALLDARVTGLMNDFAAVIP